MAWCHERDSSFPIGSRDSKGTIIYRHDVFVFPDNCQSSCEVFLMFHAMTLGAIGYSIIYLLFGGGLGGAVVIFIIAKMLRK